MKRFKVDEYIVKEGNREYSILVFPFIKYMWAYDDTWESGYYAVDGPYEVFSMLRYAMAILIASSDKIIYFPCKQYGIGRYYNENYNLVICSPRVQLRRSSWNDLRNKLIQKNKRGSYVLRYDRKKLDDYCMKYILYKDCGFGNKYYIREDVRKQMHKEYHEKIEGETLFLVMNKIECYYNHYSVCESMDKLLECNEGCYSSAMGWIFSKQWIDRMIKEEKEEEEKRKSRKD